MEKSFAKIASPGLAATDRARPEKRPSTRRSGSAARRFFDPMGWFGAKTPLVTVIDLSGTIGGATGFGRSSLTLGSLEKVIDRAFKPRHLKAVALAINSPGGSPVQSHLIMRAIRHAAEDAGVPVFAFIEDVGASGGYMLALAADEIYADSASIVGSIGVISAGFGFYEAMLRLGIERRIHTAGESKSILDAFKPERADDVARLNDILGDTHAHFKSLVRERRANALGDQEDIFSGAFWTAKKARERGLIDGIGRLGEFLRARYGADVRIRKIDATSSLSRRLLGAKHGAKDGADAREATPGELTNLAASLEARALWARYGL